MPEFPEVETIRRQLEKVLIGKKIAKVLVLAKKSFVGEAGRLVGGVIEAVERRGKILIIKLQIPNPKSQKNSKFLPADRHGKIQNSKLMLLVHLKLTGQIIYIKNKQSLFSRKLENQKSKIKYTYQKLNIKKNKYTRVVVEFSDGSRLEFRDARKFGWMKTAYSPQLTAHSLKLGPEPFGKTFTVAYLEKILAESSRAVKVILMDQKKIAGIGNIYSNEALFCAQIDPRTPGKKLADDKTDKTNRSLEKLRRCIKEVLQNGLKYKGASDQWYLDAYGKKGSMQEHFLVYGQTGKKCANDCGGVIKRITLGGRGTFYCPRCQR